MSDGNLPQNKRKERYRAALVEARARTDWSTFVSANAFRIEESDHAPPVVMMVAGPDLVILHGDLRVIGSLRRPTDNVFEDGRLASIHDPADGLRGEQALHLGL